MGSHHKMCNNRLALDSIGIVSGGRHPRSAMAAPAAAPNIYAPTTDPTATSTPTGPSKCPPAAPTMVAPEITCPLCAILTYTCSLVAVAKISRSSRLTIRPAGSTGGTAGFSLSMLTTCSGAEGQRDNSDNFAIKWPTELRRMLVCELEVGQLSLPLSYFTTCTS